MRTWLAGVLLLAVEQKGRGGRSASAGGRSQANHFAGATMDYYVCTYFTCAAVRYGTGRLFSHM